VPLARAHGVPILVDAASEFPDYPDPWLGAGADMVIYSSGKYLRGPSASGLLLGRRDLVKAAWANASPHQAVGRPLKVGREQIVGALVAAECWFARDRAQIGKTWARDLAAIAAAVSGVAGVAVDHIPQSRLHVPRLRLRWDRKVIALTGLALRKQLLDGEPRVLVEDIGATGDSILVDPFGLREGEAAVVGAVLRRHLEAASAASVTTGATVPNSVAGGWAVALSFLHGRGEHAFRIAQDGARLTGEHAVAGFAAALAGEIAGDRVSLRSSHPREGIAVTYTFSGTASADAMSGSFVAGCNGDGSHGPVADSQFGSGTWTARRSAGAPA
jgi:L-seryl-tRNA(Ser) seleniumtransferase